MPEINNIWPGANPMTFRASAILEAAGAYDPAPTEVATANLSSIQFYITYTRGGAAGAMSMNVEASPYSADQVGVENWFRYPCTACTPQAGGDASETVQCADVIYTATSANTETFLWPYEPLTLDACVERLRIPCAEVGNVGAPGTTHIVACGM